MPGERAPGPAKKKVRRRDGTFILDLLTGGSSCDGGETADWVLTGLSHASGLVSQPSPDSP